MVISGREEDVEIDDHYLLQTRLDPKCIVKQK